MQFAILASMLIVALILSLSFDVDLEAESIYKVRLWLPREWLISDWPSHRALYSSARTSSSSPLSSMHITMIIAGRRRRPLANIRRQRNAASSPVWLLLQPTHCRHLHSQHQQIPMETTKNKDLHPHQHRPCPLPACSLFTSITINNVSHYHNRNNSIIITSLVQFRRFGCETQAVGDLWEFQQVQCSVVQKKLLNKAVGIHRDYLKIHSSIPASPSEPVTP